MSRLAPLDAVPSRHPSTGIERMGDVVMAATDDDRLHRFVEDDETPSATAERIVELCDGTRTVAEIARQVAAEFEGAALAEVQADVQAFVADLVERKVLVLHPKPRA